MQVVTTLIPILYHLAIANHAVFPSLKTIVIPVLTIIQAEEIVILLTYPATEITCFQHSLCEDK